MARFVALLLIGPWLVVLGWLYWLYARRRAANGVSARFDAGVLLIAALAAIVCSAGGYQAALGHGGAIWKQVAAVLAAYAGFTVVVFAGLLRHWAARNARKRPNGDVRAG
ncbi:MAG TPA: hypothetical protein VFW60_09445 [Rhodanobacteraceae bacterium]|nr:hypothetical protein [Rhodanobacteraceae bacterium]